jgi:hypothetical protein
LATFASLAIREVNSEPESLIGKTFVYRLIRISTTVTRLT